MRILAGLWGILRWLARTLGWVWHGTLALVLLVVLALGIILGTEAGLRIALQVGTRLAPGELTVDSVSGRLLGPLEIRGLVYRDPLISLDLGRVALDWRPIELLAARLRVVALELEGVRVVPGAPAAEPPPERSEPLDLAGLRLPLEVILERIEVRDARLEQPGVPPLDHALLQARVDARGGSVEVRTLTLTSGEANVEARGRVGEALDLAWSFRAPDLGQLLPEARGSLSGEGQVSGTLTSPQVRGRLNGKSVSFQEHGLERLAADLEVTLAPEGLF